MATDREGERAKGQRSCQPRNWQRAQHPQAVNMGCGDRGRGGRVAAGPVLRSACYDQAAGFDTRAERRWVMAMAMARSPGERRLLEEGRRGRAMAS